MRAQSTKARAIKEAQALFQSSGYDGFSLQNLADLVGVRKASLYEHFRSKEDLFLHLLDFLIEDFEAFARTLDLFEPKDQIQALFEADVRLSQDHRLCSLSAVAIDAAKLPEVCQNKIKAFCALHHAWMSRVFAEGQERGQFRRDMTSEALADMIMSLSMGVQLKARALGDVGEIRRLKEQLSNLIGADRSHPAGPAAGKRDQGTATGPNRGPRSP